VTPGPVHDPGASELVDGIRDGDRRALARAITIAESTRPDHRLIADEVLDALMPATGSAVRVGVSGPPGVGKSTFIEAFGVHVLDEGHRLAVLAIDPSSRRSGGSILGDKTRMTELARRDEAFIRPSPGGGHLGGVARRTREAMLLCEAFGFDVVLVETIGVGQSEVAVADMVDLFCLLVSPGGGDELQGIKRGITELADLVVVNKADGDLAPAASRARADYTNAVHLIRPKWHSWSTEVLTCSALEHIGIAEIWQAIERFHAAVAESGELAEARAGQAVAAMWSEVHDSLLDRLRSDPAVRARLGDLEGRVARGSLAPTKAARMLLDGFVAVRERKPHRLPRILLANLVFPLALVGLTGWLAPQKPALWIQVALALALVVPLGPMLYRLAFQPLQNASVLVLLIVAVAVHFALTGLGLVFFGAEGSRTPAFSDARFNVGAMTVSGQSLFVIGASVALIVALYLFFEKTVYGKSLRATAVNRLGARLVGISATLAGRLTFTLAAAIGAVSGILVAPITTIYYDSGFLVGLKGFVAAIIGGLVSYPLAALGALLVGLLESFSSFWASAFKEVIVFTLIIPVLLWRSLRTHHLEAEEDE